MEDNTLKWMYALFKFLGPREITHLGRAIATKDLSIIARVATGLIRTLSPIPVTLAELKSAEKSNEFRKEGNLHYINKTHRSAIQCYNKALAYAPNNSLEVKLAYSNISAVMLDIGAYRDCQLNIKAALKLDCPAFLRVKLEKRMIEAEKHMTIEMIRDLKIWHEDVENYFKFAVPRNAEIPCVSADVCVDDDKIVVAAKEIKSGTLVAMERAFVSVQDVQAEYTSCYHCHRICLFFIPCEGCYKALFCSKECREKCLEDYHRVECYVVAYLGAMEDVKKMVVRATIKMSLKLTWEELGAAALEMGEKRLKKSPVGEAFDCNNPLSMLCYNDRNTIPDNKMLNASIICALALHFLCQVPGYLPEDERERDEAINSLSHIMLQLITTFLRKIDIECVAFEYTYTSQRYKCQDQCNPGWFSFTSKLAHSCEPNLLVVGFNDHVALVALRRIKKGEQLTICYTHHLYETMLPPSPKNSRLRQKQIYDNILYTCECRVCLLEWHSGSHKRGKLTSRQKNAYNQYKTVVNSGSFKQKMKAIGAALDELSDCMNTTQHYDLYEHLNNMLSCCRFAINTNKCCGSID